MSDFEYYAPNQADYQTVPQTSIERYLTSQALNRREQMFIEYIRQFPKVMELYCSMIEQLLARGFKHYRRSCLIQRIRWHYTIEVGDAEFKINDWLNPYFARFAEELLGIPGFFRKRRVEGERSIDPDSNRIDDLDMTSAPI